MKSRYFLRVGRKNQNDKTKSVRQKKWKKWIAIYKWSKAKQCNEKKTELKIDTIKVFNTKTKIYKYVQLILS